MADDFKINIGFDAPQGTQGTKGTESAMGFGVAKGLKIAGVVGILSSMKIVTDIIGVAMQMLGVIAVKQLGFFSALVGIVTAKIMPFFEDPMRYLLQFGLFIVNGIIAGIEFGLNMVVRAINLVIRGINRLIPRNNWKVSEMGRFELPRFQADLVLEAYDEYRDTMERLALEGKDKSSSATSALIQFLQGVGRSFMTNTRYQELLVDRMLEAQRAEDEALLTKNQTSELLKNSALTSSIYVDDSFGEFDNLLKNFEKKAREANRKMGGSSSGFSSSSSTFVQSAENLQLGNQMKQSTTFTQKQAASGLYLLNKLGG